MQFRYSSRITPYSFKKQVKSLENCKFNFTYLCYNHHRHNKTGVHANKKLDNKYKLKFQNYLEIHFLKDYLTREEIQQVLEIKDRSLNSLLKPLTLYNGKYVKEDVIRACLGGKIIIDDNNEVK